MSRRKARKSRKHLYIHNMRQPLPLKSESIRQASRAAVVLLFVIRGIGPHLLGVRDCVPNMQGTGIFKLCIFRRKEKVDL